MNPKSEKHRKLIKIALKLSARSPDQGIRPAKIVERAIGQEVYQRPGTAQNRLKELVADDSIPIERQGDHLYRRDL